MRIALFIGRFQPFHLGHAHIVEEALQHYDSLIILIGSAQYSRTEHNPFSIGERHHMISLATKKWKERVSIIPCDDVHDDGLWIKKVKEVVPKADAVYAEENFHTAQLFQTLGWNVITGGRFNTISATAVRNNMADGEEWKSLVPKEIIAYLHEIGAVDIVKRSRGHL